MLTHLIEWPECRDEFYLKCYPRWTQALVLNTIEGLCWREFDVRYESADRNRLPGGTS